MWDGLSYTVAGALTTGGHRGAISKWWGHVPSWPDSSASRDCSQVQSVCQHVPQHHGHRQAGHKTQAPVLWILHSHQMEQGHSATENNLIISKVWGVGETGVEYCTVDYYLCEKRSNRCTFPPGIHISSKGNARNLTTSSLGATRTEQEKGFIVYFLYLLNFEPCKCSARF